MIVLEKSFGCLSLKTGGLILGWLNIVVCALGFIASIVMLALISNGTFFECDNGNANYAKCLEVRWYLLIVFWVLLVFSAIAVIPSALLIHGIRKNRHGLLMPWLVLAALQIVSSAFKIIFSAAQGPNKILLAHLFGITLSIYFYLCIYSLYKKIREDSIDNLRNKV